MNEKINKLFEGWNETLIWSCLQGVMGDVYTNSPKDSAAMAMIGDFAFFAGAPDAKLVTYKPDGCNKTFMIMVPQTEEWGTLIEKVYGDKARKVTRYAIKKEPDIFEVAKLEKIVEGLSCEYEIKMIQEKEYKLCKKNDWSRDLVAQFLDYATYAKLGIGVVILKDGELVSGASSYSRYRDGIEIEIDTREDFRRKGLAYICGAKLILECLKRDLYPSWDAQNLWSVALAEKLGYHFDYEYTAYEVLEY